MTETIDTAQPEALRIAAALEYCDASVARQAINELRRLHSANVHTSDLCTQALDEVRRLTSALAAAEARNATRTDDAARYRFLRDMTAAPSWYAAHVRMGISCEVFDMRLDAEIARAAASISTKGDGQ